MAVICIISISAITSCTTEKKQTHSKANVDRYITVSIYPFIDNGDTPDTVPPCLLKEEVLISELYHYNGDDFLTLPFRFSDTEKYARITENNIARRIAICIGKNIVYTPVVMQRIDNGACSVVLSKEQAADMFPDIDI